MTQSPEDAADPQLLSPFPSHRDIYLLVAGVVLGVLFSGAVLGQLAPSLYHDWFVGGGDVIERIEQTRDQQREELERLADTGVSRVAVEERRAEFDRELEDLNLQLQIARAERAQGFAGRMQALVLAVLAVMVLEVLASPTPAPGRRVVVPAALSRLITVRYALMALWIALVLARPDLLRTLPIGFAALLVAVALAAAFVPLGRRSAQP